MSFNIVRYSQQDPQWKNIKIGTSKDTIGRVGCALTGAAMYLSGWGFIETPETLNKKLKNKGGFYGAAIVWGAVSTIHPQIKHNGITLCRDSDAPLAQIDAYLAAGQPVLVEVDSSPQPGLQTHWVILYAKKGGDYLILDPFPFPVETDEVTLAARFGRGKPLRRVISAVSWYVRTAAPTPPPPPVETDLFVQVMSSVTAGLRLRSQPSLDSDTLAFEAAGVQMRVIEEKAGAESKIGVYPQWIRVRDPLGVEGYVAAWYVEKAAAAEPVPVPPPPGPPKLVVLVSQSVGTSGLRLRKVPSLGGTLVAMEKAGARLTVLEPAEKASLKIGKAGQWLNVRDPNGQRGYVMAQYVELAK